MPPWLRWPPGPRRRPLGSGSRWLTGCKASRWRRPAARRRRGAGTQRSPRGSSSRPEHPVGLRRIGRLRWAGSGLLGSRMTGGDCRSHDGAVDAASGRVGKARGLRLGR
eukprot:5363923-Alexandrium_andersonii.AAC.1